MGKRIILSLTLAFLMGGCGTKTGNPGDGVAIVSSAFNLGGTFRGAASTGNIVSDFRFCVRRVRLENDVDEAVAGDSNGDITFEPGLIDLSDGLGRVWGSAVFPVGFRLKRIKVKMGLDQQLCGTDYSVRFNGVNSIEEVRFDWKFDPPITFEAGSPGIELRMRAFVKALLAAAEGGNLDSGKIKEVVERTEEKGKQKGHYQRDFTNGSRAQ